MSKRNPQVDEYLQALPEPRHKSLSTIRELIHTHLPEVVETITYRMPGFEVDGVLAFSLASQKAYMSLYICNEAVMGRHKAALAHLNLGKGCIRFKKVEDLPRETLIEIIRDAAANATEGCRTSR